MKKLIGITILVAMISVAMIGCKDDDNNSNNGNNGNGSNVTGSKISPPVWIQGKWGILSEMEEVENIELFKFTANDMFIGQLNLTQMFQNVPGYVTYTWKENKKDALYEVTITQKVTGIETESAIFSFKKGDGTYIEAASAEEGETIDLDDYERLVKLP